jgi:proteasome lid subunit RPN8/RPN11
MTVLILPSALRGQIEGEARAAFPRECCGLIEGVRTGDRIEAVALHPAPNRSDKADRFQIDPAAQFAALRAARARAREIVGCYHSHPDGAPEASAYDLEGAGEEDFLWLIAAVAKVDAAVHLAAFAFAEGRFAPVTIADSASLDPAAGLRL